MATNSMWGQPPRLATDANGNVTGIRHPVTGETIPVAISPVENSVLLAGDSMLDRTFVSSTSASGIVDNGDGTATATFPSGPLTTGLPVAVGDIIKVVDNPTPKLNQNSATVTAINTTAHTVTYTTTGAYSSLVGGSNGYIQIRRQHSPLSLFSYLNMLVGGELVITSDCSQGGAKLTHVIELLNSSAASFAKFGIFMAGRNDIYAGGYTYAQVIAAAETALDKIRSLCQHLVIVTTPPQDSTLLSGTWTTAKMKVQLQYETWLKQYGRKLGAIVIDAGMAEAGGAVYRDAASANADPTSGWTPDGTHQGTIASYALGKAIAGEISAYIAPTLQWPSGAASTYANDPTLMTDNVLLSGTGGTVTPGSGSITGTAPDSTVLAVESGAAALTTSQIARTVAADGDAAGNWFRITGTNASGTTSITFKINITAARFTNGDLVRALSRVRVSSSGTPGSGNPTNLTQLNLTCRVLTATSLYGVSDANSGTSQAHPEGFSAVMITPPQEIRPDSVTHGTPSSGYLLLTAIVTGAGGFTIDIAHPHIRKEVVNFNSVSA